MARSIFTPATPKDSTKFIGVTACPVQCRRGLAVFGHEFVGGEEKVLAVDELSPAAFAWLTKVPTVTLVEYEKKAKKAKKAKPAPAPEELPADDLDDDTPFNSEL